MKNNKVVLAIDARPLARGRGGIQRYLQKLIPLILNEKQFEVIFYSDKPLPSPNKYTNKIRNIGTSRIAAILWHAVLPIWIRKDSVDIYWSPRHHLPFFTPNDCQTIVTIHDFVWKTAPDTMPLTQKLSDKLLMSLAIKQANKIICISRTTEKQLTKFFPEYTYKSHVILHGNTPKKAHPSVKNSQQQFFLTVGTLEPRKNYTRLIEAFDEYVENGGSKNLVIVGKNGWGYGGIYQTLNRTKNTNRITVLNNADDQRLMSLYQTAAGFISISLDEGYGLPPQEAAIHNLPLLLSKIDVYMELYHFADLWVDPNSTTEIVNGLFRLEKLKLNFNNASYISYRNWASCAKEHIKLFCAAE